MKDYLRNYHQDWTQLGLDNDNSSGITKAYSGVGADIVMESITQAILTSRTKAHHT